MDKEAKPDTIYIKPPVLFVPSESVDVCTPAVEGAVAMIGEDEWFSIRSVDVVRQYERGYNVVITIDALGTDLPRFPELHYNGLETGGLSSLTLDPDGTFVVGEFIFATDCEDESQAAELVSGAELVVTEKLVRVEAKDIEVQSNVIALDVVSE